jgi:hypothetical protein
MGIMESTFSSPSGPGKRIVTANASGQLSAEPIPVFEIIQQQ